MREKIKNAYRRLVFALLRDLGYEPVKYTHFTGAIVAAANLATYMEISGAIHELWNRNPRAMKRIMHESDTICDLLMRGVDGDGISAVKTTTRLASALSSALLEKHRLAEALVAAQMALVDQAVHGAPEVHRDVQHAGDMGNQRAILIERIS